MKEFISPCNIYQKTNFHIEIDFNMKLKKILFWSMERITEGLIKNLPGLTSRRHSALVSSDSEYLDVCFSAVHYLKMKISEQRWFSSEQCWKWKFSEPRINGDFLWNSADSQLNSVNFFCNSAELRRFFTDWEWQFMVNFSFLFKICRSTSVNFQPNLRKEVESLFVQSSCGQKVQQFLENLGFSVIAQVAKLIWFNFPKAFFRLVGWTFKISFLNEFLPLFYRILGEVNIFWIRGMPF